MYKKLINVVEQKAVLDDQLKIKRAKFEEANAVLIAQIEDLKEKEVLLREEALLSLEKEDKTSVEVEDKIIYSQVRITKSVNDPGLLKTSLIEHGEELAEIGILVDLEEIFGLETVVTDKQGVLEVAKKYNELTGKELDGVNVKTTKFIAIKNKQE